MTGWLREGATVLALVAAAGLATVSTIRGRAAQRMVSTTAAAYDRAMVHDRLMGARPDLSVLGIEAAKPERGTLAWFIDLKRCTGCFDTVADWVHLEGAGGYDLVLVLAGPEPPSIAGRLRALGRTRVVRVDGKGLNDALGFILPNTKVLLDSEGTVLLADSRYAGQECGWSFEAQVAALVGLPDARPIRTAGADALPAET